MRILITNDDGIDSVGIKALADTFKNDNEIFVVAPDAERSAFSHSLTIFKDLHCSEVDFAENVKAYSTSGTPADCVKFAILHLLKNSKPDLVLSGINNGPNIGSDIMYSGTVAGAMEAAYLGVPSIAVSLNYWNKEKKFYTEAAEFVRRNLSQIRKLHIGPGTVININYPATMPYQGAKITKTGVNLYSDLFIKGEKEGSFRLRGEPIEHGVNDEDCDVEWTKKGFATITPLKLDRTDYSVIEKLKGGADIR